MVVGGDTMKYLSIVIVLLLIPIMTGCQKEITKYQCYDGSYADSQENCSIRYCPVCESKANDCSVCPVQTRDVTVTKYQCSDGSIQDNLKDCPDVAAKVSETDYNSTKHLINSQQTNGNIQFKVTYAGFDGSNYKIEFTVKNVGSETEYFQPESIAIVDSQKNQYDVYNTFDYPVSIISNSLISGVTKQGYWIFENVPKNIGTGQFSFETGLMNKETYSFSVPLN